ncbi:TCR/Tet family MFS transporter [Ideonella sp. BN130291]|uniref:TCR/Tet family MFS transporter n=1 Tax=Ideonella sp. BN130291 TaxID=3112940 RepID=UPI002E255D23|nr:TCR/Tet family MFS transporter [Ideonella sp. BN130291]
MTIQDTSTAPAGSHAGRSASMPFIMLTVLIDMVSIGLIIPVLPALVGTFTSNPSEQAHWFGVVAFAFGIASFFGSPILGALSDRYGRRPVLLLGFSGLALSFFVTAMATALWMLIAVRLVAGALMANAAVANAYVADITPPEQRAKRFGLLGAMFGIGFILGPVMGGLLGSIDLHWPFYAAGTLALLNWLYGFFVLPESLPKERRQAFEWRKANPVGSLKALGQLRGVGALVVVIGLASLAQFILHTTWVLYTQLKFGWGPKENGWSLFAVGVMSALVQGVLVGKMLKRWSAQRLAVLGLVSSTACYALWGAATEGWMMYAVIFFNVLGFAAQAAIQALVSNAADPRSQGQTMGAVASLNSLMAVAAPVIGPSILGFVSHLPRGDWRIGAPYYLCAVLQALATIVAVRHFARARHLRSAATPGAAGPAS